jgi:hypothetical protein
MAIQHRDIPDAELHEPKGVVTAPSSSTYIANGVGSGTWRKVKESDIDFATAADNKFGWHYRKDSLYTSASPLTLTTAKTLLTNNGLDPLSNISRPLGISWTNEQFIPTALNAAYVMRVGMRIKTASPAGTPYVLKVTLEGGLTPLQFAGQDQVVKGGGYVNDMLMSFVFFTGVNNTNQPIRIYVTPDIAMDVYDINYMIQRTYIES